MTRKFYILLISLLFVCTACQKGKEIDTYQPLVNLSFTNFVENWELFVNGTKIEKQGNIFRLIEKKAASVTIQEAGTGKEILKETIDITPEKASTYAIIKLGEAYTIITKDTETAAPGKFKLKLANRHKELSPNGKPINLILYQIIGVDFDNAKLKLKEKGDTVRNITSNLPDKYTEIDISDNMDFFGPMFYAKVFDENFKPIQKEGLNIYIDLNLYQFTLNKKSALIAYFLNTNNFQKMLDFPNTEIFYYLSNFTEISSQ